MNIQNYIDHTVLKADAQKKDIDVLCAEAQEYGFFSVCVNSCWVSYAKNQLSESKVRVCSVIGFPLGAMTLKAKVSEAKSAIEDGADEIDMVINIGFLKSGMYEEVKQEIALIKKEIGEKILKVIIETCYLTDQEKIKVCQLSVEAGADFVKTSTGFGSGGATVEDVQLMLDAVQGKAAVKASGGVRDAKAANQYISMGVKRLGTSNGIKIIQGEVAQEG